MRFGWNEKKASSNLAKHRVSFEEATTVFGDPLSSTYPDPGHSLEEARFITIGESEQGRIIVVSHTDDVETIRLISAREATSGGRQPSALAGASVAR